MSESWLQKLRKQLSFKPQPIRPTRMRLIGCLNCSPIPDQILPQGYRPHVYGHIAITEQHEVFLAIDETEVSVGVLARKYCVDPFAQYFLKVETPLHSETYEWDLARGRWVLVGQGMGFA